MSIDTGSTIKTNFFMWRLAAYSGCLYPIGVGIFWFVVAGLVPPPLASLDAEAIKLWYLDNNLAMRTGMVGVIFFAPFWFVWSCLIARIIQRIEGPNGVLSLVQLLGGVCTSVVTFGAGSIWLVASFRTAERSPEIIQMLNDFGWIVFDVTFMITVVQYAAWGLAILSDKRSTPLFPRWFAWATFADGATFLPLVLIPFDLTGVFSWVGLINFWVVFVGFWVWCVAAIFCIFSAVRRVELEEAQR